MAETDNKMPNTNPDPDDEPISDQELAKMDRPLHEVLGIERHFAPEDLAPPIDEQRLIALVRNELTADERDEIVDMIASFQSWNDALADVLRRGAARDRES